MSSINIYMHLFLLNIIFLMETDIKIYLEHILFTWEYHFVPGQVVKSLSRALTDFTKQFEIIIGV